MFCLRRATSITSLNTMNNMELSLDQLRILAGGVQMGPDGKGCTERDFFLLGDIFKDIKWPMPQLFKDESSLNANDPQRPK